MEPRAELRRQYRKALALTYSRCRPKRLIRFVTKPRHQHLIREVNAILEARLREICRTVASPARRHRTSKHAILAAGYLLRKEVTGSMGKTRKGKPFYHHTEEQIAALRSRIDAATQVQRRGQQHEPLPPQLREEARMMRRLRMGPAQYICTTRDRVERLETRLQEEKTRHEAMTTRMRFAGQPSMRAIRKPGKVTSELNWEKTKDFYRGLYAPAVEHDSPPWFEDWLYTVRGGPAPGADVQMPDLDKMLEEALQYTAPWKAPGADEVPAALYKLLPAAREYLFLHAKRTIRGEYRMTREDVQANTILLHKAGDASDPSNYRPIALLNTDYKVITKVINTVVQSAVADIIPPEQMARAGVWGTTHGLLLDKAASLTARLRRKEHYSAWYDFRKAFDTVCHGKIRSLVDALPIPERMKAAILDAMGKWNICLSPPGGTLIRILVRRGVYQGDSLSPMLFVLVTAGIIKAIKNDPAVNRLARGQHQVIAYVDDIKCHAPNRKSIRAITALLEECSGQLGLELNLGKCGHYCVSLAEEEDGNADLIPRVGSGYKYLGLIQTELDAAENFDVLEAKVLREASEILSSNLTTAQKRRLYNSTVIPAAVYVTGNIRPSTSVMGTLKRCRGLDLKVRKLMVDQQVKSRPTSNQRAYLPHTIGGLGFRTIEVETELQYARKYAYLTRHSELEGTRELYGKLDDAECRTPLGEFRHVARKYQLDVEAITAEAADEEDVVDYKALSTRLVKAIREADLEMRTKEWAKSLQYPRLVLADRGIVTFPAAQFHRTNSIKLSLINAAAEEQIHRLRATPGSVAPDRSCRRGCQAEETAYHVVSGCHPSRYHVRHDQAVYWLLRTILESTNAPDEVRRRLHFGKAVLNAEYEVPAGVLRLRAGQSVLTEVPLHHNNPDVMVELLAREAPNKTFLFEVSIPHLQNYRLSEGVKRAKYSRNSMAHITHQNFATINRDANLVDRLAELHRCQVRLGLLVIGCYGEILRTDEHRNLQALLEELGVPQYRFRTFLCNAAYSVITETSRILMRHLRS